MSRRSSPGILRILLALALLAAVFLFSLEGIRPPAPLSPEAPANVFSAGRAQAVLNRLVGTGLPHPTGSAADDVVRARILEEFTKLGYAPEVQTGFACDEYGSCATVKNVVARWDGAEAHASAAPEASPAKQAILIAAHYDSVPAGPGASDDGMGAATVLEIARALKSLPQPRHSIVLLIDEGEESGLLGARAFVDQHPWAREVAAAVNVDNRGTSGPSLMFETGSANAWAIRLYVKHATHPAASSIFYTAYKQLPNDTDFTVFKAAGYQGVNFAIIGDVEHYHTPLDNFENADPASLQHHGDNALPVLLALANADLANPPQTEAVYFDIFERWTVQWPATWTLSIALIAAIVLVFQIAWLGYNKRVTPAEIGFGLITWLATILVTLAVAFLLRWLIHKGGGLPVNWVAHALPVELAFWSLAFTVVVWLALAFSGGAGFWGIWSGVWIWWALLGVVIAWREPGFSYMLLVPTCVAALAGLPFTLRRRKKLKGSSIAAILPLLAAGVVGFAPTIVLYDAMGARVLALIAVLVALLLTPLAPLVPDLRSAPGLSRLAILGAALGVPILAAFTVVVVPAYSAKSPERVNLQYVQDADSGNSQWIVHPDSGRLPETIRLAASFHRVDRGPFPWSTAPAFLANAPHQYLAAPTFTVLESSQAGDRRSYRALLRSERGVANTVVFFPPDSGIASVRIEDMPLQPETDRIRKYLNGWTIYECVTTPAKGVEISFTLPIGSPVEVYVVDESYGLPLEGMYLLKARPFTATRSQDGDVTIVTRRVQLLP
ncbi:MAG: M20/M25/M40 family metallo-hydrolase [Candidatus Acidiferrales bacterium]